MRVWAAAQRANHGPDEDVHLGADRLLERGSGHADRGGAGGQVGGHVDTAGRRQGVLGDAAVPTEPGQGDLALQRAGVQRRHGAGGDLVDVPEHRGVEVVSADRAALDLRAQQQHLVVAAADDGGLEAGCPDVDDRHGVTVEHRVCARVMHGGGDQVRDQLQGADARGHRPDGVGQRRHLVGGPVRRMGDRDPLRRLALAIGDMGEHVVDHGSQDRGRGVARAVDHDRGPGGDVAQDAGGEAVRAADRASRGVATGREPAVGGVHHRRDLRVGGVSAGRDDLHRCAVGHGDRDRRHPQFEAETVRRHCCPPCPAGSSEHPRGARMTIWRCARLTPAGTPAPDRCRRP